MNQESHRNRVFVTLKNFKESVSEIARSHFKSFDTETTGLYPYHGDKVFSCAFSTEDTDYLFNFNQYAGLPADFTLSRSLIPKLQPIFNFGTVIIQKAKFDMHFFGPVSYTHLTLPTKRIV